MMKRSLSIGGGNMTDNVTQMVPVNIITLRAYVEQALGTFDHDAAENEYQAGYEAALDDIMTILTTGEVPDA